MKKSQRRFSPRRSVTRTPPNVRELALAVLDEHKRTQEFAGTLLDKHDASAELSDNDRRLAREIVLGVIRRQATLNALIEPHVARPRHQVEGALWTLLQMGAYQLVLMDSIPTHAAVHETVETARRFGKPRWCGLLNGVLRALSTKLTDQRTSQPAADAVPVAAGEFRRCGFAAFPEPEANGSAYFARAFSFPEWLANRWCERFDFAELCRLGFWFNQPPQISLRVNTLRTSRGELMSTLASAGVEAHAGEIEDAIRLDSSARVTSLPGFEEGWFVVQDESAMQAARLLNPQPGEMVLDLCAAPGTKTTHLAAMMNNVGTIIAADVQANRLERIAENSRRLGIEIIRPTLIQKDGRDVPAGPFDAVLLDVPCSNTGVLGKRPEARWRIKPGDFAELAAIQRRLLMLACDRLKPDGRLVYSTCSIEPDENQNVVRGILAERPEMEVVQEIEHVPGKPGDGGYQALFRRIAVTF